MARADEEMEITIGFSALSDADANVCAGELARWLRGELEEARVQRVRTDPASQDLGTVLTVLVSSAAAVQVARGVRAWLQHEPRGTSLDWSSAGLVMRGLTSADMVKVVEHLTRGPAAGAPPGETPSEPGEPPAE